MRFWGNGSELRYAIYDQHEVLILPEFLAVKHYPDPGSVLIRINDEGFEPLKYSSYDAVLKVTFADIDQPSIYDKMMDADDARTMMDFMMTWRDTKKLVVHCQAGISRSSATACAWAYMRGNRQLETDIRTCPVFHPNSHVYRMLVNEYEGRQSTAV